MKKKILITLSIIIAVILLSGFAQKAQDKNLYPTTMIITSIEQNNRITACTASGLTYQFIDDSEDWFVGDLVGMIMNDNNTPESILDDIIISTRYVGTPEQFIGIYK